MQSLKECAVSNNLNAKIDEPQALAARYARRKVGTLYSILRPEVWLSMQERQRTMLRLFSRDLGWQDLTELKLFDVGCGVGGNLLDFLRFGFASTTIPPTRMYGACQ